MPTIRSSLKVLKPALSWILTRHRQLKIDPIKRSSSALVIHVLLYTEPFTGRSSWSPAGTVQPVARTNTARRTVTGRSGCWSSSHPTCFCKLVPAVDGESLGKLELHGDPGSGMLRRGRPTTRKASRLDRDHGTPLLTPQKLVSDQVSEVQGDDVVSMITDSATLTGPLFTLHCSQNRINLPMLSDKDKDVMKKPGCSKQD